MPNNDNLFAEYESEVRSYSRSFPTTFTKAKGSLMFDSNGKEYIDFFDGAGALNYGHNNDYIKQKLISYLQDDGIIHALDMQTEAKAEFIDCFEDKILKPRGFNYKLQFTGPTGTNAVEAALKLSRKVKQRNLVWAFMGCFHGMTLGALSLTSQIDDRRGAGTALHDVIHIPAPYMMGGFDTMAYMEMLLSDDHSGSDKPAAIFIETVQAEGGINVFSNEFLKELRAFCDRHDILLVVDDIQVGCARCGTFFSFERAGIEPDMVVMSKSIGGYGMPMALVLLKPELDIWKPGEHNGTFRGNQLSFVAAKAGLEFMLEHKIEAEALRKGEIVKSFLAERIACLPCVKDVRGIGLVWAVDFEDGDIARQVSKTAFENGLIAERCSRHGGAVKILPALTIEDEQLIKGLEILEKAIKELK